MQTAKPLEPVRKPLLITQLTALWALNEALLGGVLHGIKLPVTGLTVGAVAVTIVCLIGYYGGRRQVLQATLVVCIIKAMLSPHTPFPAYIAVLFQGGVGALLVSGRALFTLRCVVFAVLALLESALQKLLMLTVVFGMEFWEAANEFISKLLKQLGFESSPVGNYIVGAYLGLHALAGIGVGAVAARLPERIRRARGQYPNLILSINQENGELPFRKTSSSSKKIKPLLLLIWLILTVLLIQAWVQPEAAWLPAGKALELIVRSAVILLAWYLVVGPVLLRLFKRWLDRQKGPLQAEVQAVLTLMPATLALARQCWANSASDSGLARLRAFLRQMVVNLFPLKDDAR